MHKKESRQFFMSVEGANCETLYFIHLAKLINSSERSTYKLKITPKVMKPYEFAKRNSYKPVEKKRSAKKLPYIHIQDVEDYYDDNLKEKFQRLINQIRDAEDKFNITYQLGYSNYTFELWMLLHVVDMTHSVDNRYSYLHSINRWFNRNYNKLDDYKKKDEFQRILDEYVTLDSVLDAVHRAEKIVSNNAAMNKKKENYKGIAFYRDNPDTSVHEVVKLIFEVCKLK